MTDAATRPRRPACATKPEAITPFILRSADVREGETIAHTQLFNGMGCSGEDISPSQEWSGAPAATKSYAVTRWIWNGGVQGR